MSNKNGLNVEKKSFGHWSLFFKSFMKKKNQTNKQTDQQTQYATLWYIANVTWTWNLYNMVKKSFIEKKKYHVYENNFSIVPEEGEDHQETQGGEGEYVEIQEVVEEEVVAEYDPDPNEEVET